MAGAAVVAFDAASQQRWGAEAQIGVAAGLASAVVAGGALTSMRALRADTDSLTVLFSFCLIGVLLTAPLAALDWRPLGGDMLWASLGVGLLMVGTVIVVGILGRLVLERLRLLLVPRLSILLCLVVLVITGLALAGEGLGRVELGGGVLFPIVILTMLVERFSVTLAEEGLRPALARAAWSTAVAVVVYPIFRSSFAEHLMFGFPETTALL